MWSMTLSSPFSALARAAARNQSAGCWEGLRSRLPAKTGSFERRRREGRWRTKSKRWRSFRRLPGTAWERPCTRTTCTTGKRPARRPGWRGAWNWSRSSPPTPRPRWTTGRCGARRAAAPWAWSAPLLPASEQGRLRLVSAVSGRQGSGAAHGRQPAQRQPHLGTCQVEPHPAGRGPRRRG